MNIQVDPVRESLVTLLEALRTARSVADTYPADRLPLERAIACCLQAEQQWASFGAAGAESALGLLRDSARHLKDAVALGEPPNALEACRQAMTRALFEVHGARTTVVVAPPIS